MRRRKNLWETIIRRVNDKWRDFRELWTNYRWFKIWFIWFVGGIAVMNIFRLVMGMPIWPPKWIWSWYATQSLWIVALDITIIIVWILGWFWGIWRLIVELIRKDKEELGY